MATSGLLPRAGERVFSVLEGLGGCRMPMEHLEQLSQDIWPTRCVYGGRYGEIQEQQGGLCMN